MFVGHYAAALAAKAIEPKAPLWTFAAGCQLVDIGWSSFIMAGVEHASADPALPGSALVLYDMPWTHSLPGSIAWSVGASILCLLLLRLAIWPSILVGLTVFSHWLADLLVHRPDLLLYPGGPKVGLGLWNFPVPEQAVEIGLIAVTGAMWAASRKAQGRSAWPAVAFITFLVALQIVAMLMPPEAGQPGFSNGLLILVVYLIVVAAAALADLQRRGASA
jgi:hypothetical protein